jgi:hypothetical protein
LILVEAVSFLNGWEPHRPNLVEIFMNVTAGRPSRGTMMIGILDKIGP